MHGSVDGVIVAGDLRLIVAADGSSVAMLPAGARPAPARRASIRLLPRRPSGFAGRAAELSAIIAGAAARDIIQVYGHGGVGKSALAREVAHHLKGDVAYLTAGGRDVDDVLQEIFEACYETFGHRPGPVELRRLMSGVRACVVADDLAATDDSIATVIDAAPGVVLVFTTATRWGRGETITLAGLPEEEALTLFRREVGRDLTSAEIAAASRSWRESNGSLIAMLRAAATLAPSPPASGSQASGSPAPLDPRMPAPPQIPPRRDPEDPDRTAVSPVPLTPRQRDVFELLRALPYGPITAPALTSLTGAPAEEQVDEAAARLVEVGLADAVALTGTGTGAAGLPGGTVADAYRLPSDLAMIATADAAAAAPATTRYRRDLPALCESMLAWLADPATTAAEVAHNGATIIGLIDAAVAGGAPRLGCRLARVAAPMLALSLRWGLWRDLLASGQKAAGACDDRQALAYFTHERGIRLLCLGHTAAAAALLGSAQSMWQALGAARPASLAAEACALARDLAPDGDLAPGRDLPAGHETLPGDGAPAMPGRLPVHGRLPVPGRLPAPRPPRPARRFIGRARVRPRAGFPLTPVLAAALAVVVLVVAGLVFYAGRPGPPMAALPVTATSATSATSPQVSPPAAAAPQPAASTPAASAPFAFSDFARDGSDPNAILDNDPETVWTSAAARVATAPIWIAIDMGGLALWSGVSLTPAANGVGFPAAFHLEYSSDNATWQPVPGQAYGPGHPFAATVGPRALMFYAPVPARFIRLQADRLWSGLPPGAGESAARVYAMRIAEMHVLP